MRATIAPIATSLIGPGASFSAFASSLGLRSTWVLNATHGKKEGHRTNKNQEELCVQEVLAEESLCGLALATLGVWALGWSDSLHRGGLGPSSSRR